MMERAQLLRERSQKRQIKITVTSKYAAGVRERRSTCTCLYCKFSLIYVVGMWFSGRYKDLRHQKYGLPHRGAWLIFERGIQRWLNKMKHNVRGNKDLTNSNVRLFTYLLIHLYLDFFRSMAFEEFLRTCRHPVYVYLWADPRRYLSSKGNSVVLNSAAGRQRHTQAFFPLWYKAPTPPQLIPGSNNSSIPLWWEPISWGSSTFHFLPSLSNSLTPDKYPSLFPRFLFHPLTADHFSHTLLVFKKRTPAPASKSRLIPPSPCLSFLSPSAHSAFFWLHPTLSSIFFPPSISVPGCFFLCSSAHQFSAFVVLNCETAWWEQLEQRLFRKLFPSCIFSSSGSLTCARTQTVFQSVYLQPLTLPPSQAILGKWGEHQKPILSDDS